MRLFRSETAIILFLWELDYIIRSTFQKPTHNAQALQRDWLMVSQALNRPLGKQFLFAQPIS